MNDNATAKLHEAKLCILFCLVPRASVLHGTRECLMSVSLLHDAPWSFCFYSLQKFSGQQILVAHLKNLKRFHCCLGISCSHPCEKEHIQRFKQHGSQTTLPLSFFFKKDIFLKGIYLLFTTFLCFSKTRTRLG